MQNFLTTIVSARPDRLTSKKDKSYHLQFGKWAFMSAVNDPRHAEYMLRIARNEDFYRNEQWKSAEDQDTFLKDQSGKDRNRIMFTMNMIRQLIEQYRGNSLRMGINFGLKNISPFSIRRKERKLAETLFLFEQANKSPIFADSIRKRTLVGETKEETISNFNNVYVDDFVEQMNMLLDEVSEVNEFQDVLQPLIAESLALTGLGIVYDFEYAGKQRFKIVRTKDFFFDRNSILPNLQDGEYMGFVDRLSAPQILESAVIPLSEGEKRSIENYDKRLGTDGLGQNDNGNSLQPVVTSFWRDVQAIWYGYVMGPDGYPMFAKINYVEEGQEKPEYTDKDLIPPPPTAAAKRRMGGKMKIRRDIDYIRFCRFIPYQASAKPVNEADGNSGDIVLDYGLLSYQDNTYEEFSNVNYPFKTWAWSYLNGMISSPVDDAINPQRFLNRVMSAAENQINNSGGAGVMYDKDMYDGDEADITSKINSSQPIGLNAKGRGMNNAVGKYDAGIGNSAYNMFQLIPILQGIVQGSTGVNEAMRGEAVGQDQLVGVTDALLRQGSLMQAPFYHALMMTVKQMYQAIANRGKKIYIDNEYQLVKAVGEYGARVITLSKGMKIEDFRVSVKLEENVQQLRTAADQLLNFFKQTGAIDEMRYANLIGRSYPDQVYKAVREYAGEKVIMARQQAAAAQQQQQAVAEAIQQQVAQEEQKAIDDKSFQLMMKREDIQGDKEKIITKEATKALYKGTGGQPNQYQK